MTNVKRTNCEFFHTLCSPEQQTKFEKIRQLVDEKPCKLEKARHLYDFYRKALDFGKELVGDTKKNYIHLLLESQNKKIYRVGAPPIALDFLPIIRVLNDKANLISDAITVDSKDDETVEEAAKALDQLSYEGLGKSFGTRVYKAIIKSDQGFCAVIKNDEDDVIGCLLGTVVKINNVSVFHLWACVRKANYPKSEIATKFFVQGEAICDRFEPDFITLNVEEDNKVIKLYEDLGFKKQATEYSSFTRWVTDYMVLDQSNETKTPPKMSEVSEAVTKQTIQTMGTLQALGAHIKFYAERKFNDFLYP